MLVDCFPFLLCEYLVFYGISLHQGNMRSCKNHEQQFIFFWFFRPHKCKIVHFSFRYFVLVFYVNGRGSRWSFLERFPKAKRSKSKPRLLSSLLSLLKVKDISNSFLICCTFLLSLQLTYYLVYVFLCISC